MQEIITPYIFSASALTASLVSLLFQGMLWRRSNRPIVSAYICDAEPEDKSKKTFPFKLVLINTGNMPATNIYFSAKESDIEKIFEQGTEDIRKSIVANCFENDSEVPLLVNGERIETTFGFSGDIGNNKRTGLKYDAWLPVRITYYDLSSRKYTSSLKLRIRDREGFGGAVFNIKKSTHRINLY